MSDSVLHTVNSGDSRVTKHSAAGSPAGNNSNLNPRSCVTCRRRKVKCDKKQPCANCVRAHIECIFPSPGRAPRKPRKPQDSELIERLKRLEGVVQTLGAQVGEGDSQGPPNTVNEDQLNQEDITEEERISRACKELAELKRQHWAKEAAKQPTTGLEARFGRLVVDEGRSRYINPSFWANLSNEVDDIKGILHDADDEDEEDFPSPETSNDLTDHQGFIFGLSSQNVDMYSLHPPKEHVSLYWEIYKANVDPLVKIVHVPTMAAQVLEAAQHLDTMSRGMESLMMAIYYAATTSVWEEECREKFGENKDDLLARYRFGVEQALARADFLQSDEVIVLQAFVIFLICLRRNDDARVIWTLTGLVVRMAQTLGIHRDGSHFNLTPFQIEMRRRLWWQICILDSRASEDHGSDPTIIDLVFDTQMPLNVNDDDIYPEMTDFPASKTGCTEMTFGLIRFEITTTLRKIQYVPPGTRCHKTYASATLEQKEQWIQECHKRLEERYLSNCDMNVPLYWVIATISRLIMSKMWLMIYHPFQRQDGGATLPQEVKDKLFSTSLENLEYSLLLETEEKTKRWSWLFRTYMQWHAMAFLLSELRFRTKGDLVVRAWRAIEMMLNQICSDNSTTKLKGHLWKPLKKLMSIAKEAREEEIRRERQLAMQDLAQQPEFSRMDPIDPIMSVDLGVDRLYPHELVAGFPAIPHDAEYLWTEANIFSPSATLPDLPHLPQLPDPEPAVPTTVMPGTTPTTAASALSNGAAHPLPEHTDPFNPGPPAVDLNGSNWLAADSTNSPLLPDENVDWENWDSLVEQFGNEAAQGQQGRQGQPFPYNSTFGGITQWY